jgi:ankyrin repeat protein
LPAAAIMDEITLTGGTLMASADAQPRLSGVGVGDSHGHSHSHDHGGCGAPPVPGAGDPGGYDHPSLDDLVNSPIEEINRALSTLFRFGRYEALKPLLEQLSEKRGQSTLREVLKELDEGGHSLLHWAAKRVDDMRFLQTVVDLLVQLKETELLNMASSDNVGMRPLHWASTEGSIPHIALLLKHGADMEAKDSSGCTPLLIASQYGQVEVVAYLLKKGANGSAVDTSRDTALHWAAYKGSIQVCGLLSFHQKLDWTTQDAYGQTPLHLGALRGHTTVVRYILANLPKKKGILFLKDKNERTPLDLAIHKNRPTVEAVLREAMAAAEDPRGHFFRKTLWSTLKECGSLKSWKQWLGLVVTSDEMDEPMRFPFYFVLANYAAHLLFFIGVFVPINNLSSGIMWDRAGWLFWNICVMLASWYAFFKIVKTKPGYLDDSHPHIGKWRRLYEDTLEAYADENQEKIESQTVRDIDWLSDAKCPIFDFFSQLTLSVIQPVMNRSVSLFVTHAILLGLFVPNIAA